VKTASEFEMHSPLMVLQSSLNIFIILHTSVLWSDFQLARSDSESPHADWISLP